MKKVFFVFMLSVAFIAGTAVMTKAQDETLTNQDIITMAKAGLDKMIIVGKIRSTKNKFDLSTNGLIELKKAGVDDLIVQTMLMAVNGGGNGAGTSTLSGPAATDPNDPSAPHDFGIYIYEEKGGGKMMTRLEPNVSAQNRTGGMWTNSMTYGIGKIKTKANLPGTTAKLQLKDSQPVFYFYLDAKSGGLNTASGVASTPNEFALVKFNVRSDNREVTIGKQNAFGGKGGLSDEYVMEFTSESVGSGVFKITPKIPLKNGEYGFYLLNSGNSNTSSAVGAKFFDFGVKMLP
jgi:hypothetical protein